MPKSPRQLAGSWAPDSGATARAVLKKDSSAKLVLPSPSPTEQELFTCHGTEHCGFLEPRTQPGPGELECARAVPSSKWDTGNGARELIITHSRCKEGLSQTSCRMWSLCLCLHSAHNSTSPAALGLTWGACSPSRGPSHHLSSCRAAVENAQLPTSLLHSQSLAFRDGPRLIPDSHLPTLPRYTRLTSKFFSSLGCTSPRPQAARTLLPLFLLLLNCVTGACSHAGLSLADPPLESLP